MHGEKLLTVKELCALLNLRPWAVYGLVDRGEIPVLRVGRSVRISPAALRARFGKMFCLNVNRWAHARMT